MVPLFTDRPKHDPTPGRHAESTFAFLDRSGRENSRRVRNLLEQWFEAYPVAERDRLRNHIVTDFNAGFFKLFLHALAQRVGDSTGSQCLGPALPMPSATLWSHQDLV
jgi:hypothetical protein